MTGGKQRTRSIDGVSTPDRFIAGAPSKDDIMFSWESLNFERRERDLKWYLLVGFSLLVFIGYSVWSSDWFVIGIILIVTAIAFWYFRSVKPEKISYQITPLGITAGDRTYPFSEIHSFWIIYKQNAKHLNIVFIKKYLPALTINLGDADPVSIRTVLLSKIPEQEKRDESLADKLVRMLGL